MGINKTFESRPIMRILSILTFIFIFSFSSIAAHDGLKNPSATYQLSSDFQRALELYENSDFLEAARLFSEIQTVEAQLFTGKSYFAAGHYLMAKNFLQRVPSSAPDEIRDDALFTLALCDFQAKNFGASLDLLHRLKNNGYSENLREEAGSLYTQILDYITTEQRKSAFYQSRLDNVRFDIVESSFRRLNRAEGLALVSAAERSLLVSRDSLALEDLRNWADSLPDERDDVVRYAPAPEGIMYNVGLALPEFDITEPEYAVSQGLYYGVLMAAEEFNRRNDNRKISLHHHNPDTELGPQKAVTEFAWNHNADFIIGPLFSQSAYEMAEMAKRYQIPLIPPLANSDDLNFHNPYVFQINPTSEKRGIAMARFAVRQLRMDSLAVISELNTPGAIEAQAFRQEAERLGATITHFFLRDFASRGYDVSDVTPWFAGSEQFIDTTRYELRKVDALYLAFTGDAAPTLINLIMNNLEATRSNVTILGNQELQNIDMSAQRHRRFDMFYTEVFDLNMERDEVKLFIEDYQNLTGIEPNMFAYLGYDVGTYLFQTLEKVQNPIHMKRAIISQPRHRGLIMDIHFNRDHVNDMLKIYEIKPGGDELFNLREYRERKAEEEERRQRRSN